MASEGLLSTGQAAHRLNLSTQWVRQLARNGELDAFETPLGLLVKEASVAALAARRAKRAASDEAEVCA